MPLLVTQCEEIKNYLVEKIRQKLEKYNPETNVMPFHYRLLGKDRMALFSFIHSINTMLGTSIFEQVAAMIVKPHAKRTIGQYKKFEGFISTEAVLVTDRIMRDLRSAKRKPDKSKETQEIVDAVSKGRQGEKLKKRVDLFIEMKDGIEYYFEIKSAKPNIGDFIEIKKQMLDWIAIRSSQDQHAQIKTLVAIPYNPYEPNPYDRWTLQGLFDLDEEVLVGAEFWDFLGGENTYESLLDVFEEAGLLLYDEIDRKMKTVAKNSSCR
jgi:hypothetical protein